MPIEVAGAYTETPPAGRGVGCFFSGGIDSFYTLLKHRDEITHLIFVHGWDIALGDRATRAMVSGRLREAAAELGKPLLEIETNARSLFDVYTEWNKESHGTAIGSAALTLPLQLRKVFIASTWAYDHMIPHGSHPLLDPLWGTDQLEIVHDGCECHRWQKLERIMDEDIVRRYLRSCWQQKAGEYNCCSCNSCLMNMAFLRLHGVLDQFPAYDKPLDVEKLSQIPIRSVAPHRNHLLVLELAEAKGTDPEITQALRTALSHAYKIPPGPDALNEMQLHMNNLLEQLQEAKGRIYLLEQQRYREEEEAQALSREAKQLDEQLQPERTRNAQLDQDLQAERARNARLEARLYRVTDSTSWRMTAPLRSVSEAWRRARRGDKR